MEFMGLSPAGSTASRPRTRPRTRRPGGPASSSWTSSAATSGRRPSSPASRSRTPSPPSPRPAARPTACCTCSPSRTSSASPLDIDEFGAIADRTPLIADMRPGGRYTAADLYDAGGIGAGHARAAQARRPAPRRRADRRRPDDRRDRGRRRRDRGPAGHRARSRRRSSRPAASRSCTAPSRRTAAWSSSPATNAGSIAAPRACSTRRRPASRRSSSAGSCRRRRRHPLGGPGRRPGMQEMLSVTAPSSAKASATAWRSSPTAGSRAGPTG